MKIQSAKAKGRRAAASVARLLLDHSDLDERDVRLTSSSVTGEDILLSNKAFKTFPFCIEVKNVEKLNVWEAYKQACSHRLVKEVNTDCEKITPVLFFTRNRSSMLVCLDASDFLRLVTGSLPIIENKQRRK